MATSKNYSKEEKRTIALEIQNIVQDKFLSRESINEFERKVIDYSIRWGKSIGAREMVSSGMIDHYINNMEDIYNVKRKY